jgi:hypothetical protein
LETARSEYFEAPAKPSLAVESLAVEPTDDEVWVTSIVLGMVD